MLHRLPNETLQEILILVIGTEEPLWLEHATELPRHRKPTAEETNWLPSPAQVETHSMRFSPSAIDDRLTRVAESAHSEHYRDWLMINSTCRAIRIMGKPLFFRTRPMAVSSSVI